MASPSMASHPSQAPRPPPEQLPSHLLADLGNRRKCRRFVGFERREDGRVAGAVQAQALTRHLLRGPRGRVR